MESEPKKLRLLEEVPRYIPHSVAFPSDTETLPRTIALVWVMLSAPLVVTDTTPLVTVTEQIAVAVSPLHATSAMMSAVPVPTVETTPFFTVTTEESELFHVTESFAGVVEAVK